MKSFVTTIYFRRDKEENRDIIEKARQEGYENSNELMYLGYEIDMTIEVFEDSTIKVLEIENIDVRDKNIRL
jgi:hypothetical protein